MNISKIPSTNHRIKNLAPPGATVFSLELKAVMRKDNLTSTFDQEFSEKAFEGAAKALGLTVLEKKVIRGWDFGNTSYGGSGYYLIQFA